MDAIAAMAAIRYITRPHSPSDGRFPKTMEMPLLIRCLVTGIAISAWLLLCSGCSSDPYCQQAISNLRSEKIHLENQYYSLKSQYEADMRRLGQPTPAIRAMGPGGLPMEQIDGAPMSVRGVEQVTPRLDPEPTGSGVSPPGANDGSQYIRSIEVVQIAGTAGGTPQLLIRPLDETGAVLPIAGEIQVVVVNRATNATVANFQFSRAQVQSMISENAAGMMGIYINLSPLDPVLAGEDLEARVQYRTSAGRLFSGQTTLSFSGPTPNDPGLPASAARLRRPTEESDAPPVDGIEIEFGDESGLDGDRSRSHEGGSEVPRPSWTPGRQAP